MDKWVLGTREKQALENLIKGYRELEENLKIATAMLTKGQYPEKNKGDNDFSKQFIPKSKIKEKFEKLRNKLIWGYIDWKYDEKVYMAEHHMLDEIEKELMEG